ncbi:MAG: asparagine synthase-related protein, partial [Anaerolineales bacterium]|nr:asparagine synthase-related protein [Anaerolineales bacterium]
RLKEEGYFNAKVVDEMWQRHLSGRFSHTHELWNILMFEAWLEKWGDGHIVAGRSIALVL